MITRRGYWMAVFMAVEERRGTLATKSMLRARYHSARVGSYGCRIPRFWRKDKSYLLLAIWTVHYLAFGNTSRLAINIHKENKDTNYAMPSGSRGSKPSIIVRPPCQSAFLDSHRTATDPTIDPSPRALRTRSCIQPQA